MTKRILTAATVLTALAANAQFPDDAIRYGFPLSGGTARNQAIGGVMASLGGDITAAHINPAGIGMYKNSEFVLSPNFNMYNAKYDYRGDKTATKENGIGYGTSGLVFGHQHQRGRAANSSAFSFTVNQLANYKSNIQYSGINNNSSWTEMYLEQAERDLAGLSTPAIVDALRSNYIFGTSLAYDTYLIDTFTVNGGLNIESMVPIGQNGGVRQINNIQTRGGAHEIALSFGNNYADKLHLGFSLGIPIYTYERDQVYREEDTSINRNNDFGFFEYTENYKSNGVGFNAKLGLIYRPVEKIRLGFAFHSPTFGSFTDKIRSAITADTELKTGLGQPLTTTSDDLKGESTAGEYDYNLTTPYRLIGSVAFVINEVKDITRQKGFISADVEYVNYRGVRYHAADPTYQDDVTYYNDLNELIKERFKAAFNFRVGGELKFKTIMARAGFAYLGSPYAKEELKTTRMLLSGGLGYRNKGYFLDLTYVHAFIKDKEVPYLLTDKPSPIADGNNNRGNIVFTFGVKI